MNDEIAREQGHDLDEKITKFQKTEDEYKDKCLKHGLLYEQPLPDETDHAKKKRRKRMNDNLSAKQADIVVKDLSDFEKSIHGSKAVHEMIDRFNDGELNHTVHQCCVCFQIRPVFNLTEPSSKFQEQNRRPLKTHNDWKYSEEKKMCQLCEKEIQSIRKSKKVNTPQFSGYLTSPEYCMEGGKHNNMHFLPIPPFLQNLTTIEQLMIRRIITFMQVHTLKYGMLASNGHAVSIPQDMKKYDQLPLLPKEVGVILVRNNKNSSKRYLAKRQRVQDALEGLVYGFPCGGLESVDHVADAHLYEKYDGKDHVDGTLLNGRYF